MVSTAGKYGQLRDQRYALVAILESARQLVGIDVQARYDKLIDAIHNISQKEVAPPLQMGLVEQLQPLLEHEYPNEQALRSALEITFGEQPAQQYAPLICRYAEKRVRKRELFTWRSVTNTCLVSVLANIICMVMILLDAPPYDWPLLKILGLSYLCFLVFNFFGDLVSITITRHVVGRIIAGRCNFLNYLAIDLSGILLGYVITLLPSWGVTLYCWFTGEPLNQWIHTGLLGNALIPFFLFVFATTRLSLLTFFAALSVFSITIPTAIYLSLMVFCYVSYRIYAFFLKPQDVRIRLENGFKLVVTASFVLLCVVVLSEVVKNILHVR